jgi:hypothetical protein
MTFDPDTKGGGLTARRFDLSLVVVAGLLLIACLVGVWRCAAIVPLRVPLNYNEGWNAYHAAAAMAGLGPYPPAGSFMIDNYPPASFYLVGWLGLALHDFIVAGRAVSLASFVVICGAILAVAQRLGCNRIEAGFAALLFAGFLLLFTGYVGMDDPQLLGQAAQMLGLALLLSDDKRAWRDPGGAALLVAGLFVKHNLIALPVAVLIWLAFYERGRALRLAGFMLLIGVAGLVAFRIAFGFDLSSVLNSARVYSLAHCLATFGVWLELATVMLGATLLANGGGGRGARFCLIYAGVSLAVGAFACAGLGVTLNAMFDATIAIALGSAVALAQFSAPTQAARAIRAALPIVLVAPLALGVRELSDARTFAPDFWLRPLQAETRIAGDDIAYLRVHHGPAMCAMLSLCYWAGKPAAVDVFNVGSQYQSGARSPGPLIAQLHAGAFAVLQLDRSLSFQPPVSSAILQSYRLDRSTADGAFLIPKDGGSLRAK